MKKEFLQTFSFEELQKTDVQEQAEYRKKYLQINDVEEMNSKYENILLLGSTGFLGLYLLNQLLLKSTANITLIVRAESVEQAQSRIYQQYRYYFEKDSYKANFQRIEFLIGDLTKNKFGLSENTYANLTGVIDAIINSAALVKHMGENSEFEAVNIEIIKNLIDFAEKGRKKDIHHMSTIGIIYGTKMNQERTIFTEYDDITEEGLTNQYFLSKEKAERLLFEARKRGIQSNIYRMSGILFDSKTGKYQRNINESTAYIYYRNLYKLGIIPADIRRKKDISCIDKISEAVIKLVLIKGHLNEVYHVINPHGLMIRDILNLVQECEENGEKEWIKQLVFECQIVQDIGRNTRKIKVDKTVYILEKLGFKWAPVGKKEFMSAYKEIKKL